MNSLINMIKGAMSSLGVGAAIALWVAMAIGPIYWLWLAIQIGSFWMFVLGLFPVTAIPAGVVGFYALIFDTPRWVYNVFG